MYQNIFSEFLDKLNESNQKWLQDFDQGKGSVNASVNKAMQDISFKDAKHLFENASKNPMAILDIQMKWWEQQLQIWQNITLNASKKNVMSPAKDDKRFQDSAWQDESFFNYIKQSYLLFGKTYLETINSVEGLEDKAKERLTFFSRQAINAMSPSNFIGTNPELLRLTMENNGKNLVMGFDQLQEDLKSSTEILKVRMTDNNAFRLGEDVANTPGDVVYQNDLFELIQYRPLTKKVNSTPLLFVPPFVNKFYILDLNSQKSMVRWMLEQGHTVFMMSWRNPGVAQKDVEFGDYVTEGVVKAVNAIEDITGQTQINTAGYCIGGTVLACTLAYYAAKRTKSRIKSASYFTTILDFSQPGEVGAFVNDEVVTAIEHQNNATGYMDGRSLSVTFSILRENSLYWNYYIDNYLKGTSPVEFDLLYWNSDSTNVAAKTHNYLLRELYLNNALVKDKGVQIGGVNIDLTKIKTPSYFISTKEDHIALWQGTYRGALNVGGEKTFVLGESGHIAGIINHPEKNKYGFWVNKELNESADKWLETAEHTQGSWWEHWNKWLSAHNAKEKVLPCKQGSQANPVIRSAPGEYVLQVLPLEDASTPKKPTPKSKAIEKA